MTADPLADLLAAEFADATALVELWAQPLADLIRAALRDGTLTPEDLGMVAAEEGHWLCTDRGANGTYCSPEDPHQQGYCRWVGTSYRVPKEAPDA